MKASSCQPVEIQLYFFKAISYVHAGQYFIVYFVHNCIRCGVWYQDVLHERVKLHKTWKDSETLLEKKKDEQTKLEEQRKTDRLAVVTREVSEVQICCSWLVTCALSVSE